jgi:hypothetical protein
MQICKKMFFSLLKILIELSATMAEWVGAMGFFACGEVWCSGFRLPAEVI